MSSISAASGGADAELCYDLLLDLVGEVGVVLEEGAGVLLALAELVALVGVPGAGLADEALLDAHVDEAALAGDALAVEDVELGLLERRGHLVLDDLDAGAVAHRVGAVLERLDAPHVEADRGVELQRLAAGGGLGRAEHHADLLAQLVDEDRGGVGVADSAPVSLRSAWLIRRACRPTWLSPISPSISARGTSAATESMTMMSMRAGADQHVGDLERLLAGVGLADQQRVDVDAEGLGVLGVERVLGVDERRDAAGLLRVGDRVQGERGLAARTPGRRSRRRGRGAGRRCRARRRGRSSRSG